jgi:hypothetical protein
MSDRRYSEDEVARIIATATEAQQGGQTRVGPSPASGLTLDELQDIGREVGISPELMVKAARSIDQRVESSSRRFLGLPVGVAETAYLNRTVSDEEWDRLVGEMRMTFNATGHTRQEGAFRQWSNGNLRAMLEPTDHGHRVRIQTLKSDARGFMMSGLALLGLAAVLGIAGAFGAWGHVTPAKITQIGLIGAAVLAVGAFQVPGWARARRAQMQGLIGRLLG